MKKFHNEALSRIRTDRRAAVLLSGPRGLYQYEDALLLAEKALGGSVSDHPDLLVYRSQDVSLTVEVVEEISSKLQLLPAKAERYVVVIEGVETFTLAAQNKFLKVLEEGKAFFVLIAYGEVLTTIGSRSMEIPYRPYSFERFREATGKGDVAFYISNGCPELVLDEELEKIFSVAGASLKEGNAKELLSVLSLVKEKDENCFFEQYKAYAPALFSYLGKVLLDCKCNYKTIEKAAESALRCSRQTYVVADFFKDIVRLLPEKR